VQPLNIYNYSQIFTENGALSELVDGGSYEECYGLENGPSLYLVVYLEGAKQ
jgi:hypothetical protein